MTKIKQYRSCNIYKHNKKEVYEYGFKFSVIKTSHAVWDHMGPDQSACKANTIEQAMKWIDKNYKKPYFKKIPAMLTRSELIKLEAENIEKIKLQQEKERLYQLEVKAREERLKIDIDYINAQCNYKISGGFKKPKRQNSPWLSIFTLGLVKSN